MSVKQDGAYPRTAADIERKYQFGKTFAEMLGLINDSRDHVDEVESSLRNEITNEATSIRRDTQSIVANAVRDTVKTSEFEEYKESASAELKITADGISAKVDSTTEQVTTMSGDLNTVKQDLVALQSEVDNIVFDADGEADITESFRKEVRAELDALEDSISAEVTARTEKTTEIEADLASLDGEVTANYNAYIDFKEDAESKFNVLEDSISAEVTSRTEERIQIDAEINGIKGNVGQLSSELSGVTDDITSINSSIDGITEDVGELKSDFTLMAEYKEESTSRLDLQEAQISAGVSRTEEVYKEVSGTIEDTKNDLAEEISIRESFQSKAESDLSLLSDSMTLSFQKTEQSISDINGAVSSQEEKLQKYFVFNENGLTIKAGGGEMLLVLNNDKIEFYRGEMLEENRFGWWDGVTFYTGNIEIGVNERARFGDFAFVPRSNGSLSFLKVGD